MKTTFTYLARCIAALSLYTLSVMTVPGFAQTYTVPSNSNTLIGQKEYVTTDSGETLLEIAQHFDLGINAIESANPGINAVSVLPAGVHVQIPTLHILPTMSRSGIVINLPEMRLYYYPASKPGTVMTYPIGVGRIGHTIPLAHTYVVRKAEHPVWIPPEDIRAFNKAQGITLPKVMPAGPDNPLGPYAIYLGIPTFLIHSTIYPDSIGTRASFGCIRMTENDIKDFFPMITPRTSVTIIDMPNKIGWDNNALYLESHVAFEEHNHEPYAGIDGVISSVANLPNSTQVLVDWQLVAYLVEAHDGVPHKIGYKL